MDQNINEINETDLKQIQYTVIKKDAVVNVKMGTGYIRRLQEAMHFLVKDKTAEQFEQYKKEAEALKDVQNPSFNEEWKNHVTTLGLLISTVEKAAVDQGLTRNASYDEFMSIVSKG